MVATDVETGKGMRQAKHFYVTYGKKRDERPNVGGVYQE